MKRIDQNIRKKIADLYTSGKSSTELVRLTSISETTILNIVKEFGLTPRGSRVLEEENYPKIIEDYKNGLSKRKISEKYKCGERTVIKILQTAGEYERNMSESRQVYCVNQNYFDTIDTSEKAYFLGFLWADGHNQVKHNDVRIDLSVKDVGLLEKFKKWLSSSHPIHHRIRKDGFGARSVHVQLNIKNQHLSRSLLALGMVQHKTRHPIWPQIESVFERDFIRGFLDGDGCWYIRKDQFPFQGSVSFGGNIKFLSQVALKIEEYTQIKSGVYLRKGSLLYGAISFSGKQQMIRFGRWLYQDKGDAYLDRKYQKYLQTESYK